MIDRIEGTAQGTQTGFGVAPAYREINWTGLDFSEAQFNSVTSLDKAAWGEEFKLHAEHFAQLAYHLPQELVATKAKLEAALL